MVSQRYSRAKLIWRLKVWESYYFWAILDQFQPYLVLTQKIFDLASQVKSILNELDSPWLWIFSFCFHFFSWFSSKNVWWTWELAYLHTSIWNWIFCPDLCLHSASKFVGGLFMLSTILSLISWLCSMQMMPTVTPFFVVFVNFFFFWKLSNVTWKVEKIFWQLRRLKIVSSMNALYRLNSSVNI